MKFLSDLKTEVTEWRIIKQDVESLEELYFLALEENDRDLFRSMSEEILGINSRIRQLEFKLTLSGLYDRNHALVALHAGAGGVDSQDWASMLLRMYIRWSERRGFASDVLDSSPGEETGIKSAMVQVSGDYAYGYLKSEKGVHRLVRLSPFDGDHSRHTSFALIEVLPKVEEESDIQIVPDDLRVDVFRAGGHGGQNVQKNSTAVRITHLPTNIVVTCQNERSQHQNREIALQILRARLTDLQLRKRADEMASLKGEHISAEWGNQIRSYVLHPYQMVKDHRTNYEMSNTTEVLDGGIDDLITAYLEHQVGGK